MARDDEPRNEEFQTKEYWDRRYAAEAPEEDFDWFKTYDELKYVGETENVGGECFLILMCPLASFS